MIKEDKVEKPVGNYNFRMRLTSEYLLIECQFVTIL